MAKIEVTREVKLFHDEEYTAIMSVLIDTDDEVEPWAIVSLGGEGFSLSLNNLNKLEKLIELAKIIINEK